MTVLSGTLNLTKLKLNGHDSTVWLTGVLSDHCVTGADEMGSFADIQLEDVTDVVWFVMVCWVASLISREAGKVRRWYICWCWRAIDQNHVDKCVEHWHPPQKRKKERMDVFLTCLECLVYCFCSVVWESHRAMEAGKSHVWAAVTRIKNVISRGNDSLTASSVWLRQLHHLVHALCHGSSTEGVYTVQSACYSH